MRATALIAFEWEKLGSFHPPEQLPAELTNPFQATLQPPGIGLPGDP